MRSNSPLKSVLCIHSDVHQLGIIRMALHSMANLNVHAFSTNAAALALAPSLAADLILLDVLAPVQHGLTTLRTLRKIPSTMHAPAILLASASGMDDQQHYRTLGVVGVIMTPFDALELPEQVMLLWESHKASSYAD